MAEFIAFISTLLAMASIIIFIVGMINPKIAAFKKAGILNSRKNIAKNTSIAFLAFVVIMVIAIPKDKAPVAENKENVVAQILPSSSLKQPSLNITPEEFRIKFNEVSELVDADFHINRIDVKTGIDVDTFNVQLSKNQAIIGSINKDGGLKSLTSISTGDGTMQSGANTLFLAILIVKSISPGLDGEQAAQIAMDLVKSSSIKKDGEPHTKIIDDIEYFAASSKNIGFWFGAEAVDVD